MERRGAQHRIDALLPDAFPQTVVNFLGRQGHVLEIFVQQIVVALGDRLDQRFPGGFHIGCHIGGHLDLRALAVAAGIEAVRFHFHQVDDAPEVLFRADGQLHRHRLAVEHFPDAGQGSREVGPLAVHLIDQQDAGIAEFLGEVPAFFRLHFDARDGVDDDQGRVGDAHRSLGVVDEDVVTGRVDEVQLRLVPLGERQ